MQYSVTFPLQLYVRASSKSSNREARVRALFILTLLAASLASCWNTVEDQARRLGTREFTPETWAKATDLQRGEMTASLLKKHDVTSYHRKEIVALLGEPRNVSMNLKHLVE